MMTIIVLCDERIYSFLSLFLVIDFFPNILCLFGNISFARIVPQK